MKRRGGGRQADLGVPRTFLNVTDDESPARSSLRCVLELAPARVALRVLEVHALAPIPQGAAGDLQAVTPSRACRAFVSSRVMLRQTWSPDFPVCGGTSPGYAFAREDAEHGAFELVKRMPPLHLPVRRQAEDLRIEGPGRGEVAGIQAGFGSAPAEGGPFRRAAQVRRRRPGRHTGGRPSPPGCPAAGRSPLTGGTRSVGSSRRGPTAQHHHRFGAGAYPLQHGGRQGAPASPPLNTGENADGSQQQDTPGSPGTRQISPRVRRGDDDVTDHLALHLGHQREGGQEAARSADLFNRFILPQTTVVGEGQARHLSGGRGVGGTFGAEMKVQGSTTRGAGP